MESTTKILNADLASLKILSYPDPRLREVCSPVAQTDEKLRALVDRMFELMFAARGVGLAAPQVGVTVRLFVASPTFEESDRRVYVNPRLLRLEGEFEGDEGCLSFPGISCKLKRHSIAVLQATNLAGDDFEEVGEELTARVFQHEMDHLDGRLLVDRMGSVAKLANRRALKDLEDRFSGT